jgi:hypothetical protein
MYAKTTNPANTLVIQFDKETTIASLYLCNTYLKANEKRMMMNNPNLIIFVLKLL